MVDVAEDPSRFDNPIYVLCEGPADVSLVRRVIERENLEGFSVRYAKGYERFSQRVSGLKVSRDWRKLRSLLIIGDNDTDPLSRWQNAHDALTSEGLPAPDNHGEIVGGIVSTGIFMLPRANADGTLETLLVEAILREHPLLESCLQQLDECPVTECDQWDAVKRAKMQFQTAVAITCRDDPSASARYIWSKTHNPVPIASPVFDELAQFLRRARAAVI